MIKRKYNEYEIFSKNVKMYRHKINLTQEQLAEKAYCSTSYIKQIESQKEFKNVTLLTVINICNALDIKIAELFTKDTSRTD